MNVPFDALERQHEAVKNEVINAVNRVFASGKYILGENVRNFESEFADFCDTRYSVGISSGTVALQLSLLACGIGSEDEVITAAHTYIATAFAISYTGAKPVLVDVNPDTYTLDIEQVKSSITSQTKAIIPVHLYGQCADMDEILEMAKKNNIKVIEDAAQAHGATYRDRKAGSMGDVGCFSFYPVKNLGACGDGGAITTNNEEVYQKVRMLRYMGQREKYTNLTVGFQERLDEIQAAILRVKLKKLSEWNERRRAWVSLYNELLSDTDVVLPKTKKGNSHVWHLYVIRVRDRDAVREKLKNRGIETQIHYPKAVHQQPAYYHLGYNENSFPVTKMLIKEILSLPMHPFLREEEVRYVAETIKECIR
jgi:dTDP-4-amino-4,6-dideoxygalactose transaminase